MPYYPENRIITNLYTNGGEYVLKSDGTPYLGFYHSLYDGTFFTGKTQNDGFPAEIIPVPALSNNEDNSLYVTITNESDLKADNYLRVKGGSPRDKRLPTPFYPNPTRQDYELGEFQRYFTKQINDYVFIEIDQETYDKLQGHSDEYYWQLYFSISIPWELVGNKEEVEKINRKIVVQAEVGYNFYGFSKFIELNGGYLKFYI